jgi:hypothetical protein
MPTTSEAIWAVSDGRAGLANQVLGLAEAVARRSPRPILVKTVDFRPFWRALPAPWLAGPSLGLPQSAMKPGGDALEPPWPRLMIGCGKAGIAVSLAIQSWSQGATFRVQTQDPRLPARLFDLVVPPLHDRLAGANVVPILGSPNRVTPERLAEAAARFAPRYAALPRPRVGVLIGGDAKSLRLTSAALDRIARMLLALTKSGAGLMITLSRRTGEANAAELRKALAGSGADLSDGEGDNPYLGILGLADFILVTEDSTNMATEAATTGKPIYVLALEGRRRKLERLHAELRARGIARAFEGRLESFTYTPLRETDRAAAEICARAGL